MVINLSATAIIFGGTISQAVASDLYGYLMARKKWATDMAAYRQQVREYKAALGAGKFDAVDPIACDPTADKPAFEWDMLLVRTVFGVANGWAIASGVSATLNTGETA